MSDFNTQFENFKNMDAARLTAALSEHQNSVIKLVLIVGSLIFLGVMFNDHRVKDQDLRTQISQMQAKLDSVKTRNATVGDMDNFKSSLAKEINETELITLISNYARMNRINITSLSPAQSKLTELYENINVSFEAETDNFKDMEIFLRKIEKSNFPLRINSWSGHEDDNGRMIFVVEVSAVLIKI